MGQTPKHSKGLYTMVEERSFGRAADEARPVRITRDYIRNTAGSCLIECGNTKVICTASVEDRVKPWRSGSGLGWLTAEYAMLPASTQTRTPRETHGQKGRSQEIQRLIGRSLRNVLDMKALGEMMITIDCDVIQADGGTRTASITGAWVALHDALVSLKKAGRIKTLPISDQIAAISVGLVDGEILLDLDYSEDSNAQVDMNVVMDSHGRFIEIQGTGEKKPFSREQLDQMLAYASKGIEALLAEQTRAIEEERS